MSDEAEWTAWHSLSAEETSLRLESDGRTGLSEEEARRRLELYGPNRLTEAKRRSVAMRFLAQFNDFMIWVLLAAVAISLVLPYIENSAEKDYLDAIVIMAIVLLNAALGFIQEGRAERAMRELKKLSAPVAKVLRGGMEERIGADGLVPGDVILLEAGDLVPADARLMESFNLRNNESSLTGESTAVEKERDLVLADDTPVADRSNMAFAGTHVEYGRGAAMVCETGRRTQVGQIAEMLEEGGAGPTPLQKELRDVGRRIVYICIAVVLVVFVAGMLQGNKFSVMMLFAVSLAVAAIPEGLPAIVTITLAVGTQAMAAQNAIVRNLPAVETLGCADYICSDKTGTLTTNRMTVTDVMFADGSLHLLEDAPGPPGGFRAGALERMYLASALCNDARRAAGGSFMGESTEVALMEAAAASGIERELAEERMPRVAEVPFDSDRKMMTTVHRENGGYLVLAKGAVESLLERSTAASMPDGERELSEVERKHTLNCTWELGAQALRTLAFAYKRLDALPPGHPPQALEEGLVFLGAFAMKDPPRPEVARALETCRRARIDVAMVTGDHKATAEAVGRELGMMVPGRKIFEGRGLEKLSPEQLEAQVEDISVYARVSPRHKVRIVEALQARGHVVAMTGDGVNDAPALKRADIGVAMGIAGTDVSKEASDMVLADDNFATIVAAVRQGRIIFENLKKFIYFLLSCNISEVLTMFLAMLLGFPLPLFPAQVLWINLVTDGLPALALGMDAPEKNVMEGPPRRVGENILSLGRQGLLLLQGLIITAGALSSFVLARYLLGFPWSTAQGLDMCRTILFTTMVISQICHSFNWRSRERSTFSSVPWENPYLLGSFVVSLALQMFVIYVPFMQKAFHTTGPTLSGWLLILACALLPVLAIDRLKVFMARRAPR